MPAGLGDTPATLSETQQRLRHTMETYSQEHGLDELCTRMMAELFRTMPDSPVSFMVQWLQNASNFSSRRDGDRGSSGSRGAALEDQHTLLPKLDVVGVPAYRGRQSRRSGISAEPVNAADLKAPTRVIPKSPADKDRILDATRGNILFSALDAEQQSIVVDAMERKEFPAGSPIIQQGTEGKEFYVLSEGECECYLFTANENGSSGATAAAPGKGPNSTMVKLYRPGESFGELALMYNTPRAASIIAKTNVVLWAMDRATFQKVLLKTTSEKRGKYESLLQKMPLLAHLDRYQRAAIADALNERTYDDGECIIRCGDSGKEAETFFLVASGGARASKEIAGVMTDLMTYSTGSYFGELALMTDTPKRQANVHASGRCKVLYLDKASFTRVLGPCEQLLEEQSQDYQRVDNQVRELQNSTNVSSAGVGARIIPPHRGSQSFSLKQTLVASSQGGAHSVDHRASDTTVGSTPRHQRQVSGDQRRGSVSQVEDVRMRSRSNSLASIQGPVRRASVSRSGRSGRRAGVSGISFDDALSMDITKFEATAPKKTSSETALLMKAMDESFVFHSVDTKDREGLLKYFFRRTRSKGDYIIRAGEEGDLFYMVESGLCDAIVDGKVVKTYTCGEYFGELALMYLVPRAASIVVKSDECVLWSMSANVFRKVYLTGLKRKRTKYDAYLAKVPLLKSVSPADRAKIADAMKPVYFKAGDRIIKQGDEKDLHFYLLVHGEAAATINAEDSIGGTVQVAKYDTVGDYFGELALVTEKPRAANVVAVSDVKCVRLSVQAFVRLFGPLKPLLLRNQESYAAAKEAAIGK